jgi:dihydroorotate dehydrogenase
MPSDRLAIRIGALTLPNPVICGSSEAVATEAGIRAALAAGAAGVIAKSVNEQPQAAAQLDRADYVKLDAEARPVPWEAPGVSLFNRSGLAQHDPAAWFATIAALDREAAASGRFVAASIVLGGHAAAVTLAASARAAGVRVFELNVGAPHASEARPGTIVNESDPAGLATLVAEVRAATPGMQLWVKLTGLSSNLPALAAAAVDAGADAVVMMGRFMALVPDIDSFAPVLGTSAAYGGPWALPIVCRFLAQSRQAIGPGHPLIGTNGVRCGADVLRMALAGASAIEASSVVMEQGFPALTRLITELDTLLAARSLRHADLIGRTADALQGYGQQPARPGYWKKFIPKEAALF